MGKMKDGLYGEIKGKVGNLVACNWKGIPYVRTRPNHMTNPRTEKQQKQRGKFSMAMSFLRPIIPLIRYGYEEFSQKQTPFNAAMSYTLKNAFIDTDQGPILDYNKVMVMHGVLMSAEHAEVVLKDAYAHFKWIDNSGKGNATEDDIAFLLVYNKDRNEAVYEGSEAMRSICHAEMKYPAEWEDENLAIYLGFYNVVNKEASNSVCLFNGVGE